MFSLLCNLSFNLCISSSLIFFHWTALQGLSAVEMEMNLKKKNNRNIQKNHRFIIFISSYPWGLETSTNMAPIFACLYLYLCCHRQKGKASLYAYALPSVSDYRPGQQQLARSIGRPHSLSLVTWHILGYFLFAECGSLCQCLPVIGCFLAL